jgi:glutathione S-transferase
MPRQADDSELKDKHSMITLYTFGPGFGLPDPSPFVMKAEVLLKLAGVPYQTNTKGFSKAPKGKLPYLDDDRARIADSTFIRWHLERKYQIDFDRGLNPGQRSVCWAFERMAEDHLYWALLDARWSGDENFNKGPRNFFQRVPAPIRPFVVSRVRRKVRDQLAAQGMGRHGHGEIVALGTRSIDAIATFLRNKPFFMGDEPLGVDATIFAFAAGTLCPMFETPLRSAAERHENLKAYVGRMLARFYPDFAEDAARKPA